MKVKFNYQLNKQLTLIEHKKKIEKKKICHWESWLFSQIYFGMKLKH